jgi:hypothetical protein
MNNSKSPRILADQISKLLELRRRNIETAKGSAELNQADFRRIDAQVAELKVRKNSRCSIASEEIKRIWFTFASTLKEPMQLKSTQFTSQFAELSKR